MANSQLVITMIIIVSIVSLCLQRLRFGLKLLWFYFCGIILIVAISIWGFRSTARAPDSAYLR